VFKQDIHEDIKIRFREFCLFHEIHPVFEQFGLNIIRGIKRK
jgi:hypothetical protein